MVRSQARRGSQPSNSPVQPCGTTTPISMPPTYHAAPSELSTVRCVHVHATGFVWKRMWISWWTDPLRKVANRPYHSAPTPILYPPRTPHSRLGGAPNHVGAARAHLSATDPGRSPHRLAATRCRRVHPLLPRAEARRVAGALRRNVRRGSAPR